jgi:hypothetical protein
MSPTKGLLLVAATLLALGAAPVLAGNGHGNGWGRGGSKGAPGPLAAAGLPFLLVAGASGAYRLIRRRREESRQQQGGVGQG